ncbi:MAG: hypothetical protein WCY70_02495 [Methanoculleus sp.]
MWPISAGKIDQRPFFAHTPGAAHANISAAARTESGICPATADAAVEPLTIEWAIFFLGRNPGATPRGS